VLPIYLDELSVVDRRPEAFFDRLKIDLMAVARELDAVCQAPGQVADKPLGGLAATVPYEP